MPKMLVSLSFENSHSPLVKYQIKVGRHWTFDGTYTIDSNRNMSTVCSSRPVECALGSERLAKTRNLLEEDISIIGELPRQSMKDVVVEKLSMLIASGVLKVGDSLPSERELSAALGVSRETIRGAILILSTKGILSVSQGARTSVISDDVGTAGGLGTSQPIMRTGYTLDEIHHLRLLLEAEVAQLAVLHIKDEQLSRLADLISDQEKAIDDPIRFLILDREFHTIIYRGSANNLLSDMATTLYAYQLDNRRKVVSQPGTIRQSIDDHSKILSALKARDVTALKSAFGVHERRIYETTKDLLSK